MMDNADHPLLILLKEIKACGLAAGESLQIEPQFQHGQAALSALQQALTRRLVLAPRTTWRSSRRAEWPQSNPVSS